MSLTESKPDCKVWFFVDGKPETKSEEFDGCFHLIEHGYNDKFGFWYGVIEVTGCDYFRLEALQRQGPFGLFRVGVKLDDGRMGFCFLPGPGQFSASDEGEHSSFAVLGITVLGPPLSLEEFRAGGWPQV